MDQIAKGPGTRKVKPEARLSAALLVVVLLTFIGLIIGGYTFNWTWTGFSDNKLWDWLQLLVLPTTLTAATIWFTLHPRWRAEWTMLLLIFLLAFAVLIIGGYAFNWTWTGFSDNTLWDWLKLLLLPVVLSSATIWVNLYQNRVSNTADK